MFDPSATMADVDWLRSAWDGPLVVKGIQTPADARAVVDRGADAVVVSNHGGRQLDRAPTPLEVLPEVVDGRRRPGRGVRRRRHHVAAPTWSPPSPTEPAAALVGRAYLYGLMAAGERGVDRAAEILRSEVDHDDGAARRREVADLRRDHVRRRTD